MKRMDWFRVGRDLFPLLSKGEGLVSRGEGLVSGGFMWEGLVSGGLGSFRFLVTTAIVRGFIFSRWICENVVTKTRNHP